MSENWSILDTLGLAVGSKAVAAPFRNISLSALLNPYLKSGKFQMACFEQRP